jgi:hypothetical protein
MPDDQTPRHVGRPSKLTPERISRLIEAIRAGHTREGAATLAGISKSTFNGWLASAKEPGADQEFLLFLDAVKSAEVEAEDALLAIIRSAAPKQWQASAWLLERRYPDRWGRRVKAEIAAPPPAQPAPSEVEQHLAEAQASADTTEAIARLCKARISFDEWPEALKNASGFRQ